MGVTGWRDPVWRMLRYQVMVTGWRDPVWRMLRYQVAVTGWIEPVWRMLKDQARWGLLVGDSYSGGC